MKHIAIFYQSRSGQTAKIATYIGRRLYDLGFGIEVVRLTRSTKNLEAQIDPQVDGVIIAGPVYVGKFSYVLRDWVYKRRLRLTSLKSGFFSVSLNAADERPERAQANEDLLHDFLSLTKWSPGYVASFAGAVKYKNYGWFLKKLMRHISKSAGGPTDTNNDYELTDWRVVDQFVHDFALQSGDSKFLAKFHFPDLSKNNLVVNGSLKVMG